MSILIRSTSFIMPDNIIWNSLSHKKIFFSEYGDLFSNTKHLNKINIEVINIFLPDIIDYYCQESFKQKKEKKKLDKFINQITSKISKEKNKNFIICFSSYNYLNIINSAKNKEYFELLSIEFSEKIYKSSKKNNNMFFLNLDKVFAETGNNNCFDQRNFFTFRCRLSIKGLEILADNLKKIIYRLSAPAKKVLLLDCDNTIWGGVLGEDGFEKIIIGQDGLGAAYYEFQKAIKKIKERGIIIVILSKNNKSDVIDVFKNHKSMALKHKDITSYKVNWIEKSLNIKEVSKDLFLNTNSFVFWDDNAIERNKVKIKIKNIDVINPDKDVVNWPKQLMEYVGFSKFDITREDTNKTVDYQKREKFVQEKKYSTNDVSYLKQLKIKPALVKLSKSNISRAEQLNFKTNQFNFNSKRLKANELKLFDKKNFLRLIDLKDDYGEHGLIGMIFAKKEKNFLLIDNFLLSCRILGRYLENWVLKEILKLSNQKNCDRIIFEYKKTNKNEVIHKFIKENNFKEIKNNFIYKILHLKKNRNTKYFELNIKRKIKYLKIYER